MPIKYRRYYPKTQFYRDLENNPEFLETTRELGSLREEEERLIATLKETYTENQKLLPEEKTVKTHAAQVRRTEQRLDAQKQKLRALEQAARTARQELDAADKKAQSLRWARLKAVQTRLVKLSTGLERLLTTLYDEFSRERRKELKHGG